MKQIKQFIKNNKEKLPLSYNKVIFRDNIKSIHSENLTELKKETENGEIALQFYKPITRF
ncbi:hypothetical protein [Flavobacterium sp.]|jgi:hypothetical protein|uniref:hypothetical protein n=1 Tax=Flavobacterium sp. TaxID=239 RepID=UPI0037C0FB40